MFTTDYCTVCAMPDCEGIPASIGEWIVEAKIWIEGHEYAVKNTIKGLTGSGEQRRIVGFGIDQAARSYGD